jgi:hypothetical protein
MKRVVISLILLVALNASARDVIDLERTYQADEIQLNRLFLR